jgi:hypothetical protein
MPKLTTTVNIITQATLQDYDSFIEVFKEVEELHRINEPNVFRKPEGEIFPKEHFKELIENPDAKVFLAKDNNEVVAYAISYKKQYMNIPILQPREWIYIDDIIVKQNFRKK